MKDWGYYHMDLFLSWADIKAIAKAWLSKRPEGYQPYLWITELDPIQEVETDWFAMRWAPIRGVTFNNYIMRRPDPRLKG